ncbi:glycerophosphodiester phosphodiesterase family protein [Devosia sp.]|uniref:glycerophosphodiester phosphodiesterase family protein n=1 Tax=Devosia sp. TaxID=1871048 RepID=UPI002F03A658
MTTRPSFDRPIAHRGLHDRAGGVIENSRTAFERAIARGFPIECDVQLSSDHVPVVFHDDELERLTGARGFLRDKTIAELTALPLIGSEAGDRPQRFTEFLEQIAGRTLLQIELKAQQGAAATDALARSAAAALASYKGPVTVESFDPTLIALIRRYGFGGPVGIITYAYDKPDWEKGLSPRRKFALRHLLHWPWSRFDFISCHFEALQLPAVRLFRSLGVPVTAWTVRDPAQARLAAAGADQIVFEGFDPESA